MEKIIEKLKPNKLAEKAMNTEGKLIEFINSLDIDPKKKQIARAYVVRSRNEWLRASIAYQGE